MSGLINVAPRAWTTDKAPKRRPDWLGSGRRESASELAAGVEGEPNVVSAVRMMNADSEVPKERMNHGTSSKKRQRRIVKRSRWPLCASPLAGGEGDGDTWAELWVGID